MTRAPMAGDPLIAALDAAREKGCTRAVLLTDCDGEIAMNTTGVYRSLSFRMRSLRFLVCVVWAGVGLPLIREHPKAAELVGVNFSH